MHTFEFQSVTVLLLRLHSFLKKNTVRFPKLLYLKHGVTLTITQLKILKF